MDPCGTPAVIEVLWKYRVVNTTAQDVISSEFAPGVLRKTDENDILYPNPATCGNGQITVCVGCRTIKVCIGSENVQNPTQTCPKSTPYCNSSEGGCSMVPDDSQETCSQASPELNFRCTGVGKYPDPHSCTGYYYCEGAEQTGDFYKCQSGYTYNSKAEMCQRASTGCKPLNCTTDGPILKVYPSNNKFFYYCWYEEDDDADTDASIIMFSCGDGSTFDSSTGKCVYKCLREGTYAKSTNPNMYYQCYWLNGKLTYIERSCPLASQEFDDKKKLCVTPVGNARRKLLN
ncbi:uncharacterized protein LOC131433856 [Malaya genurostris]|uniref:uncharacterized protein LOC131433856 n=1 Tax=Malaya genurostris TaxID=325434 RepID=UPI0026F3F6E5|nr:uncharacterized protein LOC131433856 [Malaya genurostris]